MRGIIERPLFAVDGKFHVGSLSRGGGAFVPLADGLQEIECIDVLRCVHDKQCSVASCSCPRVETYLIPAQSKSGQKTMKSRTTRMKTGTSTGRLYLKTKPMKDGIFTPDCSAMAFTMKLGPFPM